MEPREPVSGFETRAGLGGGGLEGGGAHVGCVKRRISDTINHTLSNKSKFFSDLIETSTWEFVSLGPAFGYERVEAV